jgi:hypothetical protein
MLHSNVHHRVYLNYVYTTHNKSFVVTIYAGNVGNFVLHQLIISATLNFCVHYSKKKKL